MAYSINGKVYTDHPMMDEVCFNCKKILNGIVIKNDVLALNCETEESVREAEIFYIQEENGYVPFSIYPFTIDELIAFGYNDINAKQDLYLSSKVYYCRNANYHILKEK